MLFYPVFTTGGVGLTDKIMLSHKKAALYSQL